MELAARYRDEGADELVFYDISASPEGRTVDRKWIGRVARTLDIPFCVAAESARWRMLKQYWRPVPKKSPSIRRRFEEPELIDALSERFGAQCVVVGIDSQTVNGGYRVQQFTRRCGRSRDAGRGTLSGCSKCSGAVRGKLCSIAWRATACAAGMILRN